MLSCRVSIRIYGEPTPSRLAISRAGADADRHFTARRDNNYEQIKRENRLARELEGTLVRNRLDTGLMWK
jgi:hypothetical protein